MSSRSARRPSEVESTAKEVELLGRRSLRVRSDVTDAKVARAPPRRGPARFRQGRHPRQLRGDHQANPTLDVTDEQWSAIIDTNLTGTLRACQVFGRHMLERGYGRIVNIASLASFVALYEVAAYAASKAAVASLTKSLAIEWGARGVCVNAIAPGVFVTPLNRELLEGTERGREFLTRTPMKRFGKVEELVGACVFLSSEASSFVNGEILAVDGGFLASGVNR